MSVIRTVNTTTVATIDGVERCVYFDPIQQRIILSPGVFVNFQSVIQCRGTTWMVAATRINADGTTTLEIAEKATP